MSARGEEQFIQKYLAPLTEGFSGAHELMDDCAEIEALPGHVLIFKTDPIIEGVHFFAEDKPCDIAWKALAVNVSDLAAKGARPLGYLMALRFPDVPDARWLADFTEGLECAQQQFGSRLIGGDTDQGAGPLTVAITMIGEMAKGRMRLRRGAAAGDLIYISGDLGDAALGLQLRLDPGYGERYGVAMNDCDQARLRYLRPMPRLGLRAAVTTHARAAMDVSDGLGKDLDRMCRLSGLGAELALEALPLTAGTRSVLAADEAAGIALAMAGDAYEVLAAVPPNAGGAFERLARAGGVDVTRIGRMVERPGVSLQLAQSRTLDVSDSGYDHFDGGA